MVCDIVRAGALCLNCGPRCCEPTPPDPVYEEVGVIVICGRRYSIVASPDRWEHQALTPDGEYMCGAEGPTSLAEVVQRVCGVTCRRVMENIYPNL